jgi:hypothetical protein
MQLKQKCCMQNQHLSNSLSTYNHFSAAEFRINI